MIPAVASDSSDTISFKGENIGRPSGKKLNKKRVAFRVDENDRPETLVFPYFCPSPDLNVELFWSQTELASMLRKYKSEASIVASQRKDAVESVKLLFSARTEGNRCGGDENNAPPASIVDEGQAVEILTGWEYRGLERRISPTIRRHRQITIKHLLEVQDKLSGTSFECREFILSRRSLHLTRGAVRLAIKLAEGDASQADAVIFGRSKPLR